MNDEIKEYYVKRVREYSADKSYENRYICLNATLLSIMAVSAITTTAKFNFAINLDSDNIFPHLPLIRNMLYLPIAGFSITYLIMLVRGIARKAGFEARIDEIKEFFEQHGLVLEDEMQKGRSM